MYISLDTLLILTSMDFTFPGEVGKIKGHWKYTWASKAVQTFATDSS